MGCVTVDPASCEIGETALPSLPISKVTVKSFRDSFEFDVVVVNHLAQSHPVSQKPHYAIKKMMNGSFSMLPPCTPFFVLKQIVRIPQKKTKNTNASHRSSG